MDRETLLTSNRSLAEESLARRPRLNNGKLQLAEKYRELSNLATTCWEKQSQLGEFTPELQRQRGGRGVVVVEEGGSWFWFHIDRMSVDDQRGDISQEECGDDDKVTGSNSRTGWLNLFWRGESETDFSFF